MQSCSEVEQSKVVFPSEEEIKSYFPDDVWNNMSEYERSSYRNILHNYNVMRYLDLKPKKPSFMALYPKKAFKKKANSSKLFQVPAKKIRLTKEKPLKKIKEVKEQQKKDPVIFSNSYKRKCIRLHCVFNAVFKVYKRYFGSIKGHYLNKRKSVEMAKKHMKVSRNKGEDVERPEIDVSLRDSQNDNVPKHKTVVEEHNDENNADVTPPPEKKSEENHNKPELDKDRSVGKSTEETSVDAAQDNAPKDPEKNQMSVDMKKEKLAELVKRLALHGPKPLCRSVQTTTVAVGCSPDTSALVFVNAASIRKLSRPIPDPAPLTPKQQKLLNKINHEKMKHRRNVQTQTAPENSSIEEAKLVFFPVKRKKPQSVLQPTQPGPSLMTDKSINKTPVSDKATESSEDDEFGFLQMAKDAEEEETTAAKIIILETKHQPKDEDLAVPAGCSSWPSGQITSLTTDKSINKTPVSDKATESSEDDEFGFLQMDKDAEEEKAIVANVIILETKHQPKDEDLAVPGCSSWPSGQITISSIDKRINKTPVPDKSTELSEDDEFGFLQMDKDAEEEKALAIKPSIPEIKHQPSDNDLAVPGCSNQPLGKRYPQRAVPVVNYTEAELLQDDEYLFCDFCDREYEGDCPEHGPHKLITDTFTPATRDCNRATQTTPIMLKIAKSKIPGAGSGVWTDILLPPHVRFGPYQEVKTSEPDPLGYSWAIVKDKRVHHYIAAHSPVTSNWMRYVNCARHESEQNVMAFQYKGQMYYRTVKLIPPKAELFVWYGKEYAEILGISTESFRSKDISHLRNVVFTCVKCQITYTSPLYLEAHSKHCRGRRVAIMEPSQVPADIQRPAAVVDGRKTYSCNVCSYKTTNTGNIKRHLITHTGVKPHVCDVCGKGFKRADHLDTHKRVHTGVKPYKCDQCEYACNESSNLIRHKRLHTEEKVYACVHEGCKYTTLSSSHMKTHTRIHTGERPYHCPHCEYSATQKIALDKHIRTHTGERPYHCPHCEYCATVKGDLDKHIRTHTGERPYHCPHCKYSATRKDTLDKHTRTHTGERPYHCPHCQYSATQKGALDIHTRTHTGERPYQCPHCKYSATEKGNLNKHIATQHSAHN